MTYAQEEETTDTSATSFDLLQLNLSSRFAGECVQRLLQEALRNNGIEKRWQKLSEGATAQKNIKDAKRLTAGVLISNREHCLDQNVLDIVLCHRKNKKDKLDRKARKKEQEAIQQMKKSVVSI